MALRDIVKEGEPVLRQKCFEVTLFNERLGVTLDDMIETMRAADGVGLAAPQVGVLRRVVVIETPDEGLIELINPKIIAYSGEQTGEEGCLSVPGRAGIVTRPMHVTVRALNRHGETVDYTGSELLARAFCHELDHLDGKLYIDVASEMLD